MLHYKEMNEYDGIESYVRHKIDKRDITWFPIGQSIKLNTMKNHKNLRMNKMS